MTEQTVEPVGQETAGQPGPAQVPALPAGPPDGDAAAPPPLPEALQPQSRRPPRRVLRAVARWSAAVIVFGALGTGTAFGIASMERTDVPALATEDDGRWAYPELSLPALPEGSPRPFSPGNIAEIHHADLRKLLLPAPADAEPDKRLTSGWTSTGQYVSEYREQDRERVAGLLADSALRHITARGWTTPDGTRTRVYLLQFNSAAFSEGFRDDLYVGSGPGVELNGGAELAFDEGWNGDDTVPDTDAFVFTEKERNGRERMRVAYVQAGDTLALIIQRGGEGKPVREVPFHQTLILQDQLLG
ncbi:hypothetical protein [Streptomyces sp. bgisy091]|uniref:hypothetical protein n=1 Tax=Streptomyces sp. bgisy091 TaxID=3413778 RepID=UPI003D716856